MKICPHYWMYNKEEKMYSCRYCQETKSLETMMRSWIPYVSEYTEVPEECEIPYGE